MTQVEKRDCLSVQGSGEENQNTKLNARQQCAPAAKKVSNTLGCISKSVANKIERSDPSPPLRGGEATSAVLYPVLGLLAQERHSEFFKLHEKIGASVIQKG